MNIYDIKMTENIYGTTYISVVAESMGEVERVFKAKYRNWGTIKAITLHSSNVLVQGIDDKKEEDEEE